MWEAFDKLCKERGVSAYRVGEETGDSPVLFVKKITFFKTFFKFFKTKPPTIAVGRGKPRKEECL